ncbi:hypothetical protein L596_008284 [Steinernema carpocapsae]|uniref:Repulsive guidance molecule N-terminal domain-containing protein n=1 Tax=Steinernema carpocapsae TaxID=34508 RepID=A0A4U5PC06_STECR|nr:hypothetical protein L596_008284 [Steinernema carpocapsae]
MRPPSASFLPILFAAVCFLFFSSCPVQATSKCRSSVMECGRLFPILKDYGEEHIRENPGYCKLLWSYHRCLNRTSSLCHGDIHFNAQLTIIWKQRKDFRCSSTPPSDDYSPSADIYRPSTSGFASFISLLLFNAPS